MRYSYHLLDVFTDRVFGGNPLAVFPDGQGLSTGQMQRVAAELNLSETVFVFQAETEAGTRKLRIFTPAVELPFAGHPTVGTAVLLAETGAVPEDVQNIVLEETVGPVAVRIAREPGRPTFAQLTAAQAPEFGPPPPPTAELARVIGLDESDLLDGEWAPGTASCGVPFLILPVRSLEALARVRMDQGAWERVLADTWAPHVYIVAPGADLRARMFAPAMGLGEDPATGAAATALAAYLARRENGETTTQRWTVQQGVEMGRPSTLYLEAEVEAGSITAIRVGGSAVLVGEGWMEIPSDVST
ncbi:MAG TPA: PhzF family phenazine biosynthesis protein [Longimicrobium sp.]|jgi:trans-2,3-dihydro-3-hydroxyanthranilate isomerase|uniref:PhzF family phenazine biosynthesis protein n=1 Tax=Longimicrobium sp. TaxID=2029185 RepID=UPI002ED83C00